MVASEGQMTSTGGARSFSQAEGNEGNRGKWLTIEQVSRRLKIPKHTIRFWEKAFPEVLLPLRTAGGHRRYCDEDIEIILKIKKLRKRGKGIAQIKNSLRVHQADPSQMDVESFADQVARMIKEEVYRFLRQRR